MAYTSIMVCLQLGQSNRNTLAVTADLAERFGAQVFGIALCQPIHISCSDAYLISDLAVQDREARMQEMATAETEFREALHGRALTLGWHASMTTVGLASALAVHARNADLLVTRSDGTRSYFESSNPMRVGDLVLQAGRPVLVVPNNVDQLPVEHVLIGWKDSREARRAIADSLPLLAKARRVTVVEIAPAGDLRRHATGFRRSSPG